MKNIPERIYLQVAGAWEDDDFNDLGEVTWCREQIEKTDIPYIRLHGLPDLEKRLEAEAELITKAVQDIVMIAQTNTEEAARNLIASQFLVISRMDLSPEDEQNE